MRNLLAHLKYFDDVNGHRLWVLWFCVCFAAKLVWRGLVHDLSKYRPDEFLLMSAGLKDLQAAEYGSEEYKEALRKAKPAIELHYARNSHHPEFYRISEFSSGVDGMNLHDLVEMFCDWKAACRRNPGGSIQQSVEINRTRQDLSDQLYSILKNSTD